MNQHNVQEAYLKNFETKGQIWVIEKKTGNIKRRPAGQCTAEEDFQSYELERFQNDKIESRGITKLRKIDSEESLTNEDATAILNWTALHSIRNKRFREESGIDYNDKFYELLEIEIKFTYNFRFFYTYKCQDDKFFISSDNPVLDFTIGQNYLRILPWSPSKLIVFTPIDDKPIHSNVEFTEMTNSMIFSKTYEEIYSHKKELPLNRFRKNVKRWNLEPQFEEMQFKLRS